jgi:hypothetical protein
VARERDVTTPFSNDIEAGSKPTRQTVQVCQDQSNEIFADALTVKA